MKHLKFFLFSTLFLFNPLTTFAEEPAVTNNGIIITSPFIGGKTYFDTLETIIFQVSFNTGGAGVTGGVNPQLVVNIAGTDYFANYNSGSGSATWTFNLAVSPDMNDANSIKVKAFDLTNGGITDSSSGDPLTALGADFTDIDITTHIDGRIPTFSSTTLTSSTGIVNGGIRYINSTGDAKVTINLNDNDTRGTTSATLDIGGDSLILNFTGSAKAGTSHTYQKTTTNNFFTGKNGPLTLTNIAFQDFAGKSMVVSPLGFPINGSPENIIIDTINPVINFSDDANAGPVQSDAVTISFTDINLDSSTQKYLFTTSITCNNSTDFSSAISNIASPINLTINDESKNGNYICAQVTDKAGNKSFQRSAEKINIDVTKPTLTQITPIDVFTKDITPDYIFKSDESGTISYVGSCSSSQTNITANTNTTITLNSLNEGVYNDCKIRVTDAAGNISLDLPIPTFTVDTTAPTASNLVITSSNANNKLAKTNDTITVTFTTADNLGNDIKLTSGSTILSKLLTGNTVSGIGAGKTILRFTDGSETSEVEVPFSFKLKDNAGNESIVYTQNDITGANVKFDRTNPIVQDVKISATSSDSSAVTADAPTYYAKQGDTLDFALEVCDFVDSVAPKGTLFGIANTTLVDDGNGAACTTPEGNASVWHKWKKQLPNINGTEGNISFDFDIKDSAGNILANVTGTTDASTVIFDKTSPALPTNVVDLSGAETLNFKPFEKADYSWTESVDVLGVNPKSGLQKSFFRFENTNTGINENITLNSGTTTFTPSSIIPDLTSYKLYADVQDKAGNKSGESVIYTQKYGIGISGKVTDQKTGKNITGTNVQIASKFGEACDTGQNICSATTNSNGDYLIIIAPNQTYKTTFIKTPNYYIAKTDTKVLTSNVVLNSQLAQTEGLDVQGSNQQVTIILNESYDTTPFGGNISVPVEIFVSSFSGEISTSFDSGDLIITSFSKILSVNSNNPDKIIINEGGNKFRVKNVSGISKVTDENIQERATSSTFTSGGSDLAVSRTTGNGGSPSYSGQTREQLDMAGAPGTFATYEESLEYAKMMNKGVKYKVHSYVNRNGHSLFSGYQSGRLALSSFKRFNGADYVVFRGSTQKKSDIFKEKESIKKIFKQTEEVIVLDENNQKIILKGADFRVSTKKVSQMKNFKRSGYGKKVSVYQGINARSELTQNKINKFERQRDLTAVRQSRLKRKSLRGMYLGVGNKKVSTALIFAGNNF